MWRDWWPRHLCCWGDTDVRFPGSFIEVAWRWAESHLVPIGCGLSNQQMKNRIVCGRDRSSEARLRLRRHMHQEQRLCQKDVVIRHLSRQPRFGFSPLSLAFVVDVREQPPVFAGVDFIDEGGCYPASHFRKSISHCCPVCQYKAKKWKVPVEPASSRQETSRASGPTFFFARSKSPSQSPHLSHPISLTPSRIQTHFGIGIDNPRNPQALRRRGPDQHCRR